MNISSMNSSHHHVGDRDVYPLYACFSLHFEALVFLAVSSFSRTTIQAQRALPSRRCLWIRLTNLTAPDRLDNSYPKNNKHKLTTKTTADRSSEANYAISAPQRLVRTDRVGAGGQSLYTPQLSVQKSSVSGQPESVEGVRANCRRGKVSPVRRSRTWSGSSLQLRCRALTWLRPRVVRRF